MPGLVQTKHKKSLVLTFWAGVNTNQLAPVPSKQLVWDLGWEVVSGHFQTNQGVVQLTCEKDRNM